MPRVEQLALLDAPAPPAARARDPETSQVAAASMRLGAGEQHAKILAALERLGAVGGTYTEVAKEAALEPTAVDRRLVELRRLGLVVRLAETRRTPSNRPAHVHIATQYAPGPRG